VASGQEEIAVTAIHVYPVKGLSPQPLDHVDLSPGDPLPHDRRYAIENGPSPFDPAAPAHLPKNHFLMLMRNGLLARLRTVFDPATTMLVIEEGGREAVRGDLSTADGRAAVEVFLARYCADELRGPPRILEAPGFSFSDTSSRVLSIVNMASVRALEQRIGLPVDPLRFRGNLHVEGLPPWGEFDLVGRTLLSPSGVALEVVKRIDRCAATNVDPVSGVRDMNIPRALMRAYDHVDCGVYARVAEGGRLVVGERFTVP
jgi:uncharacterized protein YcbX